MEEASNSSEGKEKWQEIIEDWRTSGLSKAEFCRKQKIVKYAFYYWYKKLEGSGIKSLKKRPRPKPIRKPEANDKLVSRKNLVNDKLDFVEILIPKSDKASHAAGRVFRITTSYGAVMEIPI